MGLIFIKARIINPANPQRKTRLEFLVDSGATYSVAPKTRLKRIGIQPHGTRIFTLADGTRMTREIGAAIFSIKWRASRISGHFWRGWGQPAFWHRLS